MTSRRRLLLASAIAAVVAAALLPGAGLGSPIARPRGAQAIPAGLADAIHARFGGGPIQLADSPTEHPSMGDTVAMSADGTTALVSAIGAGNLKGAVYVYHVADAGSWVSSSTPVATLSGTKSQGLGELFGDRLALSSDGTTAFVGAPFRLTGSELGAVLVFHVADESSWASTSTPAAALTIADGNMFTLGGGLAVSSDGTTLVVGDPGSNSYQGAGYIFHASSESAWASTATPTATLTSPAQFGSHAEAGTGVAISADGTTALVGAVGSLKRAGSAYLFHVANETAWASSSPTAILSNASGVVHDDLGWSVALSTDGTTAFVGAPGVHGYAGAVDVFHAADASSWVSSSAPAAILTNGSAAKDSYLGDTVAVSADGKTVASGADGVDHSTGAVDVFRASGEDAWASSSAPTAVLTDSTGARGDVLAVEGLGLSSDGATVLAGAPGVNWRTGDADVVHVADAGSWATTSTPTATLTNSALPKPRCIVPGIKGYHLRFAKELLSDANCRLGTVKAVHSTKKHRQVVLSQSPAPKRNLPPGARVDVKIGK